jgi:hypothetical protein
MVRDAFTTCLLVPIIVDNRVVGVVQIISKLRDDSHKHGNSAIVSNESVKPVDSSVLSAAAQRCRRHMHMLRSGRADLMAFERLPVIETHSSPTNDTCSPSWWVEASSPVFDNDDVQTAVAAAEACGQMISLACRACHSVKLASNMSRFAHLIQVDDSGRTLSEYACKVVVELMASCVHPRSNCLCSVFLLQQNSKARDSALVHISTSFEGVAPDVRVSEKDVELVTQIVTKNFDSSSIIICCPIRGSLANSSAGDGDVIGVMVVQLPASCHKMSDAEADAIKVVCQHLAEALKNSSAVARMAKDQASKQQYAAIEFLGNCIGCSDVNSVMTAICRELSSIVRFDSAAVFSAKPHQPHTTAARALEREWTISHVPEDVCRLSGQMGILRTLGNEVVISASSIGPLVVEGPDSAANMFTNYHLATSEHSTKVSEHCRNVPKQWTGKPLHGCLFGVPLCVLQDDGSLHVCGSVVLVRDGHGSKCLPAIISSTSAACNPSADFFEHNDVQLTQALMFKIAKLLVKMH